MRSRRFACVAARCMILIVSLCIAGLAQTTSPVPQIANPLVPTAVAPGSAAFTLTVNGTGFVSGSTVYWNGSPRTTTYVSAAQLTATIGAADVATASSGSVTIHNPGGPVSNPALLLVTHASPTIAFGSAEIDIAGSDTLAGDLNGDGNTDVVINRGNLIVVANGNADGSLLPATQYSFTGVTGVGRGSNLGDLNGDGYPDVLIAGYTPASVQTYLNNGQAGLETPLILNLAKIPEDTVTADVNGDGKLDVVFTASLSVGVALGNGDGTFQTPIYYPLPNDSYSVTIGDFNRDGIPDIATSVTPYAGISVLMGNGDGTFGPQTNYDFGHATFSLAAADLNGDGYPDLIGPDINPDAFYVLMNRGDGTFLPSVEVAGTDHFAYLNGTAIGDINGDGYPDAIFDNSDYCYADCLQVFLGNGDGTFQPALSLGVRQDRAGASGGKVALADFNHDGKLDVATTTSNGPYLMLQTAAPAPTLVPGVLSYPSTAVGVQSLGQDISLFQPGSTAITIINVTATGDFVSSGGCIGYVLQPGNSGYCNTGAYFVPTTTGVRTGSLVITSSGGTQYVYLTGTGTAAINVSVTPSSINFGTAGLNSTSYTQWVYLTNTGSQTLNLNSITLTGANAGDFLMTNPCGATLAVGASCTVTVNFRPTVQGVRTASVAVSDNAANSPQTVALNGTGNALHVSNNLLSFGNVTEGTSNSLPVTLRNLGTKSIVLAQIRFIANAADYSQTNTCNGSIAPRSNCTMTVTFTPQTQGQLNSVLSFSTNGTGTQAVTSISLRGRGE